MTTTGGQVEDGVSDEVLLGRFARGDREALGVLAERYEAGLVGLAMGLLNRRRDLAGDAVQDAWVRVIGAAGHFDGRSSFKTWVYRIVINRCHDVRGRAARGGRWNGNGAPSDYDGAPAPVASLEGAGERVRLAVERLSGEQRLLLLLCYHAGVSHPQAAEILGIPVGTMKSRLHAALERLRAMCESEGEP